MARAALIAGASGLVGGFCLRELLRDPQFQPVISFARRPLAITDAKLQQRDLSFENLGAITDAAAFCALGTTIRNAGSQEAFRKIDFDYPLAMAKAARAAGATTFVLVSSIGADATSSTFYLRVKGELEQQLKALAFPALHIFQPSFLMGDRKENRPGERIGIAIAQALQWAFLGPLQQYRPVAAAHVGSALVEAVRKETKGVTIYKWPQIRELLRDRTEP